ncbi:MAG: DUF4157 domain-containing protein [Comamonadaceae bacterium]|nr:DUF4157 domain-containing protein [Comamonadaceae bacterium]
MHDVIRSSGEPLESATRSFMETRFARALGGAGSIGRMAGADGSRRCDFGDVRVHTDERAAASARVMNARAYAVGHHIVFDSGAYAPGTAAGNELLAHELAHVAQQTGEAGPHRRPGSRASGDSTA